MGLANVQSEVTSLRPGVPIGVTTTLKGFPEPVHIEVPLFTLLCQLAHLARDGRINRAQRLENQLNYLKARDKVDKFWDFILRRRPDQTVAEVLREWEDEDRVITELADTAAVLCDMAAKAQSL